MELWEGIRAIVFGVDAVTAANPSGARCCPVSSDVIICDPALQISLSSANSRYSAPRTIVGGLMMRPSDGTGEVPGFDLGRRIRGKADVLLEPTLALMMVVAVPGFCLRCRCGTRFTDGARGHIERGMQDNTHSRAQPSPRCMQERDATRHGVEIVSKDATCADSPIARELWMDWE